MTFKVKDGIAIAGTTFVDGSRNITAGNITAGTVTAALSGNATTATNVAWSGITSKPTTISGFGITDAPTSTGTGASGTWSINVTGNAGTATTLQTTRTINGTNFNGSANIDTTEWIHSGRDFPLGTLVQTTIDYSVTAGDPWVLEIKGNAYGSLIPFDIQYQGYIYTDTIINHGGYSNGTNITGLVVFNYNGKLCFWWPSQTYWHGYNIRVYTAQATRALNKVTTITNEAKPAGVTKEVALSANIRQSLHSTNYNSYSPTLTGTGASGTWGISITGNAATVTNGVYTNGSYADPAWITSLAKSKVGLANVENTALSTWAGSTNITTIGAATASSLSVTGNLTVNGTTTTVNSTTVTLDDPILTLGGDTAPTVDDNKDRGIEFRWHNGTAAKIGFFGFDDSTGYLTFIPDATNTSEVFSGTQGDIQASNFRGALVGNASTASTLQTARTINGVSFNGSANISITRTESKGQLSAETLRNVHDSGIYTFITGNASLGDTTPISYWSTISFGSGSNGSAQIAADWISGGNNLWFRSLRDTVDNWWTWKRIYHDNYHPEADKWTTARTLTVGNTGKSVDGTANVSWTLAEIGAYAATNPSGYITSSASITGNAATATTWQTARTLTIGNTGKSVDGSANVSWNLAEIGVPALSGLSTFTGTGSFRAFSIRTSDASGNNWSWFGMGGTSDSTGNVWHVATNGTAQDIGNAGAFHIRGNNGGTSSVIINQDHSVRFRSSSVFLGATTNTDGVQVVTNSGSWGISVTGTSANVTGTVAVANGGTGATTNTAARTNLGATTVGSSLFTLTNPSAITFLRVNADNTVSALDAATFRGAIGAGTSSTVGTVTSVGGTGTVSGLSLSGTVTTSGNLTLGGTLSVTPSNFASQTANTVLAAPNGAAGVPTFRALVAADIPTLNQNTTGNAGTVTNGVYTNTTNILTGSNTFRNTGGLRVEQVATQDAVIIKGGAGTSGFTTTFIPAALTTNRTIAIPDATGYIVLDSASQTISGNNTFTGQNIFRTISGLKVENGSGQDAIALIGRGGGSSGFTVSLVPTTLTAGRIITLPDLAGTFIVDGGSYANPAWITSLSETKVLPSQTGHSGKFLTTNGTSTSWGTAASTGKAIAMAIVFGG